MCLRGDVAGLRHPRSHAAPVVGVWEQIGGFVRDHDGRSPGYATRYQVAPKNCRCSVPRHNVIHSKGRPVARSATQARQQSALPKEVDAAHRRAKRQRAQSTGRTAFAGGDSASSVRIRLLIPAELQRRPVVRVPAGVANAPPSSGVATVRDGVAGRSSEPRESRAPDWPKRQS
jgi:hypothetical protein